MDPTTADQTVVGLGVLDAFVPGTGVAMAMLSNRLLSAEPLPTVALWVTALASLGLAHDLGREGS